MDFTRLQGTYPLLALGLVLLLVAQNWLIRQSPRWLGALIPAVCLGYLLYCAVTGTVLELTDFLFSFVGFIGLLGWWASARSTMKAQVDDDRAMVVTPMTAVDSRDSFPPPGTGVHRHYQPRVG